MADGRVTIDVVIPSIRLDARGLLEALHMDVPPGAAVRYYVVSDNPSLRPGVTVHRGVPVHVMVNADSLGAPLSRNVGLEAGTGRYVLFVDDDVAISPGLLRPYLDAILEDPGAPGYVGPTVFPDPVNSFTRGIVASGMLTFFGLPANPRLVAWGTTSNLMVRRDAVGDIRFSADFPKHGGGEDIDFCIRVAKRNGRWFRTVPGAAVRHPWWRGAARSYARFFRWSFGDSRLVRLHPEHAYRGLPDMVETLALGSIAMLGVVLAGALPLHVAGIWAGLVVCSEFGVEQAQVRSHHPDSSVCAGLEAAAIRISNQLGRFLGPLSRGDVHCIFRRFDYICTGEWMPAEQKFARAKFAMFVGSVPLACWLGWL